MLAGTIVEKDGDGIMLETNELSFDGTEEYSHTHPIALSAKELKGLKKGSKVKVTGKFARDENRRGKIEATAIVPNYDGEDMNLGEIGGIAHRSFQFFKATGEKQAFGNVIVRMENELMIRGVCFQPTCHRFNAECTTGSEVVVLGRIQHREYVDRGGDTQTMLEVVGNDDFTKVTKSVTLVNPFEAEAEKEVAAI